jgi:Large ribosomal RNA subunit accumulation protein YceD
MTEASEFSRPVEISRLPAASTAMTVEASGAECAALARRFSLLALERLAADLKLEWIAAHLIRLEATLSADIVQECVVTLEPVRSHIEDRFVLLYGAAAEAREVLLNEEEEVFEPIVDGRIDLGEAVAQQLSLAIDPFPRAPGAIPPSGPGEPIASPFAALANWSKKG